MGVMGRTTMSAYIGQPSALVCDCMAMQSHVLEFLDNEVEPAAAGAAELDSMYQLLNKLADRKRQQLDSNGAVALQQARTVEQQAMRRELLASHQLLNESMTA